ncbi:cellulose-binding protein [Cellulomonas sp. JZ18]|uniref:cellulose binding domain-containing protein n=1 Tax=Cellulomonas sp. JZ18 TaxID=2654191 RepID=UPI0012D37ACE|nr:cellulose binding domain-containing protein [Cellulomonas sp. JZ18]QGQ18241.1 cellulose-binding protein [Cellulomonas sp. JZ18]
MTTTRLAARTRVVLAALAAAVLVTVGLTTAALHGSAMGLSPARCSATFTTQSWSGGFVTQVRVTTASALTGGWVVDWMDVVPGTRPTHAWNATVTATPQQGTEYSGAAYSARYLAWNASVPAGGALEFGFQGTATSTPREPMNVRLNGELCTGYPIAPEGWGGPPTTPTPTPTRTWNPTPTPTSTPTPTPTPTPTAPTLPPEPTPTMTTPPTPTPQPTPSRDPGTCTGSFCDGFETQTSSTPSAPWTVVHPDCSGTGRASIDSSVARTGSRSLRVDGAVGYCNHVFVQAQGGAQPAGATPSPTTYLRFWVRHTTALPASHVTFLAMRDANDGGKDLRMGGQNGALQWNRSSDDATLPEQSPAGVALSRPLPTQQWHCVEALVDSASGRLTTWLDGAEVPGLVADGVPTHDVDRQWYARQWAPRLTDLRLGWESYGDGADTLWFDDVVTGTQRTGC